MDVSNSIVHLGIQTDITGKVYIEGRIDLRRKSVYSLMGAGFHWGNGLRAAQNGHIWSTFVIPRLLYGLKVQLLKKQDIANLERFQRHCLKQFQVLPDNTSNSVSYALFGILPIEAMLHKNLLNTSNFVNMIRHENSIEFELAQRQ